MIRSIFTASVRVAWPTTRWSTPPTGSHIVTQQKMAAPYRLVLTIGQAEPMVMHGRTGEMMLSGKSASCRMGSNMSGMSTGAKEDMRDLHFGNNVYAVPGRYTVTTSVNRVRGAFSVQIG